MTPPKGNMPPIPTLAQVLAAGNDAEGYDLTGIGLLTAERLNPSRDQLAIKTGGGELDTQGGSVNCGSVHTHGQAIGTSGGSLDLGGGDIQQQDGPFVRAAYVDPSSGTVADVVQALVDAGLMAAS